MRPFLVGLLLLSCNQPLTRPSATLSPQSGARGDATYDVVIKNGDVIDGTGRARFRADVGINGDTIAAIGSLGDGKTTIDAKGQVVAPGFIDLLGHSEGAVLIDPHLEGKIRQGVTTEVTGEGHSPGPINDAMAAEMMRTRPEGFPDVTWRSLGEYIQVLERHGSAINFALFIGAANSREIVIGTADRAPTAEELAKMKAMTAEAVKQGAMGLSTALIYPPGRFATTEELIALASVTPGYWTHLRSESDNIMSALDEAFRIGREAHVPVNIFHIKVGGAMRGHMPEVIAKIEAEQKRGLDVEANIYPYTATSTDLTSVVPAWALDGGYLAFVARLKDPAMRAKIAGAMRVGDGSTILIRNQGKRLAEIAKEMNTTPAEAALRLFEGAPMSPVAVFFGLTEEDMQYALKQPWVAIGSDSGAVVASMRDRGAHPRAYGTFPRILGHYVRDVHLFPLEEAVRKMTSLAAARAGFRDRGTLKAGMKADVVVFNPQTIRDVSTYEDPHHYSEGISTVIVNGKPVLREGKMTSELPGKVLKRGL